MKFPIESKIGNVVPIHKKVSKKCVKNYRPVSLLPICKKICLSETFLNSEILTDDENLQISGYSIARVGHPSNTNS